MLREVDITKEGITTNKNYRVTVELYDKGTHLCVVIYEKEIRGIEAHELNLGMLKNKEKRLDKLSKVLEIYGFKIKST